MKVICDRCGGIVDDKEKRRYMLWYPYTANNNDIEYILCVECAEIARGIIEKLFEIPR